MSDSKPEDVGSIPTAPAMITPEQARHLMPDHIMEGILKNIGTAIAEAARRNEYETRVPYDLLDTTDVYEWAGNDDKPNQAAEVSKQLKKLGFGVRFFYHDGQYTDYGMIVSWKKDH